MWGRAFVPGRSGAAFGSGIRHGLTLSRPVQAAEKPGQAVFACGIAAAVHGHDAAVATSPGHFHVTCTSSFDDGFDKACLGFHDCVLLPKRLVQVLLMTCPYYRGAMGRGFDQSGEMPTLLGWV